MTHWLTSLKRVALAISVPFTLAVALAILSTMGCNDTTAEKEESFRRGYMDAYKLGSRTGEQEGYREGYADGYEDGDLDVFGIYDMMRAAQRNPSEYVRGATSPWDVLAWCDAALSCDKQWEAELSLVNFTDWLAERPYVPIPDVDFGEFDSPDDAYDAGFKQGMDDGQLDYKGLGRASGYIDGYEDVTCASGLPQKFGLYCPE